MTLPLFITRGNKYLAGAIMYSIAYALYYPLNHYPVFEPRYLSMTWIDLNTPLVPWSVLIYISEYFYFGFVYVMLKKHDNINKYLYSYFFAQVVACSIFFFYPVSYPRELYPIPSDTAPWLQDVWIWLRNADAPTNCLPSLHVASVYLSAFAFITDGRKKVFWLFFIWSSAIAFTTLTTKQHYVVDIFTGMALGGFSYWWFHHKQKYKRVYPVAATQP